MIGERHAAIVPFRPRNPVLEFHCRRRAESGRALQEAQDRVAEAQRQRDELLEIAAQEHARVAEMTPGQRFRRAVTLGLTTPPNGPEVA